MVQLMRPADTEQVFITGFKGLKAVVDKPIVKYKVSDAIKADTCAYPKAIVGRDMAQPHQP